MRCEAIIEKVEAINWIFMPYKFSNLMRCEAKLTRIEAIDWNAHAEQVQQLDALGRKIGKKLRPLTEMLTQKKLNSLMRFEAKIEKVEAFN